jgi:hypothetical protein
MFGLFNFFKSKKNQTATNGKAEKSNPQMLDLDENSLAAGDVVEALRYDLGKCKIIVEEGKYFYESLQTGEKVSWLKMIDAATERQKVKKVKSSEI